MKSLEMTNETQSTPFLPLKHLARYLALGFHDVDEVEGACRRQIRVRVGDLGDHGALLPALFARQVRGFDVTHFRGFTRRVVGEKDEGAQRDSEDTKSENAHHQLAVEPPLGAIPSF